MWIRKFMYKLRKRKLNKYIYPISTEKVVKCMADMMSMATGKPYLECLIECSTKDVKIYCDGIIRSE